MYHQHEIYNTNTNTLQGASSGDDRRGHIASSSLVRQGQSRAAYWLFESLPSYFIHPGHLANKELLMSNEK